MTVNLEPVVELALSSIDGEPGLPGCVGAAPDPSSRTAGSAHSPDTDGGISADAGDANTAIKAEYPRVSRKSATCGNHCITSLARAVRDLGYAAWEAARIRRSMDGYIRAWATSSNAAALRENAVRAAGAFLARLPEIAAPTGGRAVCGYKGHVAVPPSVPDNVTCLHCGENISPARYAAGKGWIYWHTAGQGYMDERCPARECSRDDFGRHVPAWADRGDGGERG